MRSRVWITAVACCISACAAQTSQSGNGQPQTTTEAGEPQYPFVGFLFTGRAEALEKLRRYGMGHGLTLKPYPQWPTQPAVLLTGEVAFSNTEATRELVNKAQSGEFGDVSLGVISDLPSR